MSTSRPAKRRPSDVASDLFRSFIGRFRRHDKRSLSTGDLSHGPIIEESNYLPMDFPERPTTSCLEPNFDDCDRVPMDFSPKRKLRLIPQFRKSARRLMRFGSVEDINKYADADITLSQPWFYPNIDSKHAEHIIRHSDCEDGTFLVHHLYGYFQLVLCFDGQIYHRRICHSEENKHKWRIGLEKSYRNIEDLVKHYRKEKGDVLPTELKKGCVRSLRYGTARRTFSRS